MAKIPPRPSERPSPNAEPGIDPKTLYKKLGFDPHSEGQTEFLYSKARFNAACCGRRWGKSQTAGHRMTHKMFKPDSYNWDIGPTYKLGEKEFRVTFADFKRLGLLKYCKKSYNVKQGDMRIETPWGSILEVVSAEKQDSLLGEGLSHAIMCEAAKHSRSTWEQYIEPALSDLLGSCDFPTTPQGFNWFHGIWTLGQYTNKLTKKTHHKEYKSWQFPSWTNTVRYPGGLENEEIQRIKKLVSNHWFLQEYGAQFTAITGAIYTEWDEEIHVHPVEYNPALPNYLAFDYGFVNPTIALDIQITPDESVHVWREYYAKYLSTMEHGYAIRDRENPPGYEVAAMWGDPRGADEAATLALILGFVGSHHVPWKPAVEQIKRLLKLGKLVIDPSCVNLIREMGQLHIKPLSRNSKQDLNELQTDGNIQHKVDDHCCDALRYFIGPYFVSGAGSHLTDIYGENYAGSESQSVYNRYTTVPSESSIILDEEMSLNSPY